MECCYNILPYNIKLIEPSVVVIWRYKAESAVIGRFLFKKYKTDLMSSVLLSVVTMFVSEVENHHQRVSARPAEREQQTVNSVVKTSCGVFNVVNYFINGLHLAFAPFLF